MAQYQSTVGGRPCASVTCGRIAQFGELADVGAAPLGAAGGRRAADELDLAAGMGRDPPGHIADGDLLGGADVIDAEMLALVAHHHHAAHQIVDVAEAAGLAAVAVHFERHLPVLCCATARLSRSANCGMTCSKPMSGP